MDTFKGYGAYYGYDFLKNVILEKRKHNRIMHKISKTKIEYNI